MYAARERSGEDRDYTTCPVCSQMINGSPEELNEHVELCLNRVSTSLVAVIILTMAAVEHGDNVNKQGLLMWGHWRYGAVLCVCVNSAQM